nr:MAG TPA: hypothetical protein [Caudoviricetes sp.]
MLRLRQQLCRLSKIRQLFPKWKLFSPELILQKAAGQ